MARCVAGLGHVAASAKAEDILTAYGLGSCIGVVVRDARRPGWVLGHVVLPGPEPKDAGAGRPVYYAVPGVTQILRTLDQLVGGTTAAQVSLYGGAVAVDGLTSFEIGRRNLLMVRRELWRLGIVPVSEDVEGTESRTVTVHVGLNRVTVTRQNLGAPEPEFTKGKP